VVEEVKSDEELKQIAFLDELRAADHSAMPERPLAVVVDVTAYREVPKAGEKYALATVSDGRSEWSVCLPRDVVAVGQRAVFLSEDAIIPFEARYDFGRVRMVGQRNLKGGRASYAPNVRRNVYRANQGILYPVSIFPELGSPAVGDLVDGTLGILSEKGLKAEKLARVERELAQARANKVAKKKRVKERLRDELTLERRENHVTTGPAPDFVQRTELESIENCPELFEQYTDCLFEVTEKMCGVNLTVYCDRSGNSDRPIGVCLNGLEIKKEPAEFYWSLVRRLGVEAALLRCSHDLVIEGVVIGPGIRGGRFVGYRSNEFRIFDIYDLTEERVFQPVERKVFCKEFKLLHVPIISYHTQVFAECHTLEELRAQANGRTYYGYPRRGIVLRSEDPNLDVWVYVGNPDFCEARIEESRLDEDLVSVS